MAEANTSSPKSLSAVIDRVESGLAVIVLSDDDEVQFDLPLKYLPAGSKEGDHLKLTFEADPASAEAASRRVAELKRGLNQSSPDEMNFKL